MTALRNVSLGSSPLTRGKRISGLVIGGISGLIPAHAGKTRRHRQPATRAPAHPRSRGENVWVEFEGNVCYGSSPLTRGKRDSGRRSLVSSGLIPAHAGKTGAGSPPTSDRRAHPRSRGENASCSGLMPNAAGSSPLTRGKRGDRRDDRADRGLIPAHAGKTWSSRKVARPIRAHPRSRGENTPWSPTRAPCLGSSPLTRGKHFLTCAFIAQIGQILESLELCASSESYSLRDAYATDVL